MKIKKYLFLVLFIIIALLFIPNTVNADTAIDEKGISWTYDIQNGEAVNVKPTDKTTLSGEITIPSILNDQYNVTSIGDQAFSVCSDITKIIMPDTVTSTGEETFYLCENLTSVTMPNSVTTIGRCSFQNCFALQEITIPNTVTTIGNSAFNNCSSLTSITIPDNVTTIGNYAFAGCDLVTNITIPEKVTTIGNYAFAFCDSLTSVIIPNSVTSIGDRAFVVCPNLKSIMIPKSVTSIGENIIGGEAEEDTVVVYGYPNSEAENYAKNTTLNVKFIGIYTVTVNTSENADIFIKDSYITSTLVEEMEGDAAMEIIITAKQGYKIKAVKVNDVEQTLNGNLIEITNITENQNVVVETEKETYKVTFDANEGTFKDGKTVTIEKWENGMEDTLEIPTRAGYKFLGFFTEKTGGTKLEFILAEEGIVEDEIFYAQWEKDLGTGASGEGESEEEGSPIVDNQPNVNNKPSGSNQTSGNNPQTGDNIVTVAVIALLAVVGMGLTIKVKKYIKE